MADALSLIAAEVSPLLEPCDLGLGHREGCAALLGLLGLALESVARPIALRHLITPMPSTAGMIQEEEKD